MPAPLVEAPPVAVIEKVDVGGLPLEKLIANVYPSNWPDFTYMVSIHDLAVHQWGDIAFGRYEAAHVDQPAHRASARLGPRGGAGDPVARRCQTSMM